MSVSSTNTESSDWPLWRTCVVVSHKPPSLVSSSFARTVASMPPISEVSLDDVFAQSRRTLLVDGRCSSISSTRRSKSPSMRSNSDLWTSCRVLHPFSSFLFFSSPWSFSDVQVTTSSLMLSSPVNLINLDQTVRPLAIPFFFFFLLIFSWINLEILQ